MTRPTTGKGLSFELSEEQLKALEPLLGTEGEPGAPGEPDTEAQKGPFVAANCAFDACKPAE